MNPVYFLVTKPSTKLENTSPAQTNPISKLESFSSDQTLESTPAPQTLENIPAASQTLENISVSQNSEDIPVDQSPSDSTSKVKGSDQSKYPSRKFWNADMESDLIRLVKKEDSLWNTRCKSYKDRASKLRSLDRVMKGMRSLWPNQTHLFNFQSCQKKFKNIRTYYRKERLKIEMKKTLGKPNKRKWIHFDDLYFLDKHSHPIKKEDDASYSPIIIQFAANTDTSQDMINQDDISRMLEEASAEDETCYENMNDYSDCQTKEVTTTAKTKVSRCEASNSYGISKAQNLHKLQSSSKVKAAPTKNSKHSEARVVKIEPNSCNREKRVEMSHDQMFGNFIGKDMEKIPEGKQKEQLRFQIIEMIHRVKMNEDLMFE